ncbi:MAG: hypothetical protein JXR64_00530 [Spirochaetales bacterium]|nr:hypothetical protein [Spirochaetales bacterium]
MSSSYEFVLAILFICVGIPVLSGTIISIIHGPKEYRKKKWKNMNQEERDKNDRDQQMLEDIYYGLKDLGKRVSNLETILDDREA